MWKLVITSLFISSAVLADEADQALTSDSFLAIYRQVAHAQDANITNKGNYLLVTSQKKFYAFTKPDHPGYPGYIEWEISVENSKSNLKTKGVHGSNGESFHLFEEHMNKIMVGEVKARLGSRNSE